MIYLLLLLLHDLRQIGDLRLVVGFVWRLLLVCIHFDRTIRDTPPKVVKLFIVLLHLINFVLQVVYLHLQVRYPIALWVERILEVIQPLAKI